MQKITLFITLPLIAYSLAGITFWYNNYYTKKVYINTDKQVNPSKIKTNLDPLNVIPDETKGKSINFNPQPNLLYYSEQNLTLALKTGKVLLYFSSSKCENCIEFISNYQTYELPDDIILIIVNIENLPAIARYYNIQAPDTFVQLNDNRQIVSKFMRLSRENILNSMK